MNAPREGLRLSVLGRQMAVCRLDPTARVPDWATTNGFFFVTRTPDGLSVACPQASVPEGVEREGGWCVLKLEGPFEFSEVGVLASVTAPLAEAGVGIFAVSTFDTDYALVKEDQLDPAVAVLRGWSHEVL